jgi:hypothetical protein
MACGAEGGCTVRYGQGTIWSAFGAREASTLVAYHSVLHIVTSLNRLGTPIVLHIQRRGSRERYCRL